MPDWILDKLTPFISVPGLYLVILFIPNAKLVPWTRWHIDGYESFPYLPCLLGAFVGYFYPKGNVTIKRRVWIVGIIGFLSVSFIPLYEWISSIPVDDASGIYLSSSCFFIYLVVYFAIGFFFVNFGKVMLMLKKKED